MTCKCIFMNICVEEWSVLITTHFRMVQIFVNCSDDHKQSLILRIILAFEPIPFLSCFSCHFLSFY